MIRELRAASCTCVFFNAWHHQQEKHLFAALMEQIRHSWRPRGHMHSSMLPNQRLYRWTDVLKDVSLVWFLTQFYWTLWSIRFRRAALSFIMFTLSISISLVTFVLFLILAVQIVFGIEGVLMAILSLRNDNFGYYLLFVAFLSGSFATFLYLWTSPWNVFRAFPVSPSSLLAAPMGKWRLTHSSDGLSFRYRFQSAFREVCDALHDRHLVIIIDDLDRCSGDQVFEILEGVNFLTSSGNCFVLLAMDEVRVKLALAERHSSNSGGHESKSTPDEYLKKIVTMTVRVPAIEPSDLAKLRGAVDA